ncbi:MAG: hypothetical protein ABI718_14210 [Acidobacteriota bacterium]
MEIPSRVAIFNTILEIKGKQGTLIAIDERGYFEVSMDVSGKLHTVLFPIDQTVLIFNEPLAQVVADFEVER